MCACKTFNPSAKIEGTAVDTATGFVLPNHSSPTKKYM